MSFEVRKTGQVFEMFTCVLHNSSPRSFALSCRSHGVGGVEFPWFAAALSIAASAVPRTIRDTVQASALEVIPVLTGLTYDQLSRRGTLRTHPRVTV